jgi:hypothetical protein
MRRERFVADRIDRAKVHVVRDRYQHVLRHPKLVGSERHDSDDRRGVGIDLVRRVSKRRDRL